MPTLSPAWPWSSSFRNISTPVQVVFSVGLMPTISISSPTLTMPRSTRPVTTVPRPEMENTSSTGIRKAPSTARSGVGNVAVQRFGELHDRDFAQIALVAFQGQLGRAVDDRGVVAREVVLGEQLAHFDFDEFEQLGVVDHVDLFRYTMM